MQKETKRRTKRFHDINGDRDGNIEFSETTNLIEQSVYHYSLQDRETPYLYRQLYSYDAVPRVSFNHRYVPMNMPDEIWITDTTFRDGQQSRAPFTVDQIVDLFTMLHKLGGPKGIIRQTEFFVYTEKDREALARCMDLGNYQLDSCVHPGFSACEKSGHQRDRRSGFLQ